MLINAPDDHIFQLAVKNEITILYERKLSHEEKNIPAPREQIFHSLKFMFKISAQKCEYLE